MIPDDLTTTQAELAALYEDEHYRYLELPVRTTTLDDLTAETGAGDEELTDHDVAELALLVKTLLRGPGLPDDQAAALGLGETVTLDDGETDFVLNETGRRVLRKLILEDLRDDTDFRRLFVAVEPEEIQS